ncbi:MAG: CPBP family intramembrane metalloprotease [Anaerolineales bacterium]|nr:CPBP family intramembrane metalloprotease [Anaerolineales bacterium]
MKDLFRFNLKFNRKIVIATISSTLLLMVDHYHRLTDFKPLDRFILYLLIPLLIIIVVLRENPKEYGFQLGDWKAGLALTGIVIAIAAPILWVTARGDPTMQKYYEWLLGPDLPTYVFLDLIGWEFIFRGWLLFGYARVYGSDALWLQSVPFALAHIGKPEIETFSTIFGGFLFGLVAWRTKSFLYPFLIHYFIFAFTVLVAGGVFG